MLRQSLSLVPALASLLSLSPHDHALLHELSPQKRKQNTLSALLALLKSNVKHSPVLIVFEDVHWIDPTSLELLTTIVQEAPQLPLLVLITARPEFIPPWPNHAHVTTLALTRLSRSIGAALVERITDRKALPQHVLDKILAQTDGVPLFIEELTKAVLESGLLREQDGCYVLDRPLPSFAIPTTLYASLMARLDRLGAAKEVAQIGAAIGREFSHDLLRVISGWPQDSLESALAQLVQSELVFCRGERSFRIYTFKHVMVRDVAYAGLLKSRRAELHAQIASAFEQQFLNTAEPELLAHHFTEAGLLEKAVEYWIRAGRKAAARSANKEAIAHLERGLQAVKRLAEDRKRDRLELDLQFTLAPCLIAAQGPAENFAVATFTRAHQLCARLGDAPEYLQVMFWLVTPRVVRGELPQALEEIAELTRLAETRRDHSALLNAVRGRAMILLFMGRVVEAQEEVERAITSFELSDENVRLNARSAGQDAGAAAFALVSWSCWLLGDVEKATIKITAALDRAHAVQHPHTLAYVSYYASVLYALRGEAEIALQHAERCLSLAEEHGFGQWRNLARAIRGISMAVLNPLDDALALNEVRAAFNEYRRAGYELGITALDILWCPALLMHNQPEAAMEVIEQGLSTAEGNNERIFEAELYRLKAKVVLARASPSSDAQGDPESLLQHALKIASGQKARVLEFRAAKDLAALWVAQGRSAQAARLLASHCGSCGESPA